MQENFFIMSNYNAQRTDLSYEAKGLLCELLSRPSDWVVHKNQLMRKGAGEEKLHRIFTELKNNGYIQLETIRENGKIVNHIWNVYSDPQTVSNLNRAFPGAGKAGTTNKDLLQETEKTTNTIIASAITSEKKPAEPVVKKPIKNPPLNNKLQDNNSSTIGIKPIGTDNIAKEDKIAPEFIQFWKNYGGWRTGMKKAWEEYKKHPDYLECLPLLYPAVMNKKKSDDFMQTQKQFAPQWKHITNWIAQRGWEDIAPLPPVGETGYEPEINKITDLFGELELDSDWEDPNLPPQCP